ncbi:MAG: type II secretion system protein [Helicobacteraceae bacterium]|nr:type II secretion system protein [Helicobacteraceae bacterium]
MRRSGFAMIAAIVVIVLISMIAMLMVSLSTRTLKEVENTYLLEQAQLLTYSATEYTLLAISGHDRSGGTCVNQINSHYPNSINPVFDINVTIKYIGLGSLAGCEDYISSILTSESNATVLVDVYVNTNEALGLNEQVSFHRRTLQKP